MVCKDEAGFQQAEVFGYTFAGTAAKGHKRAWNRGRLPGFPPVGVEAFRVGYRSARWWMTYGLITRVVPAGIGCCASCVSSVVCRVRSHAGGNRRSDSRRIWRVYFKRDTSA